jgi:hypothetical protein
LRIVKVFNQQGEAAQACSDRGIDPISPFLRQKWVQRLAHDRRIHGAQV